VIVLTNKVPNPFKPTAGANPPLLVGRQDILDFWNESLDDGPGAPGRITIFTGARGVGKTVMLNEVGDLSRARGWLVVDETATAGVTDRIDAAVRKFFNDLVPAPGRKVTGVTLPMGLGGLTTTAPTSQEAGDELRLLLEHLHQFGTGLVVTLDEIHKGAREDLRRIAALTQHMVREGRDFAVAMAGLPASVSALLSDDVTTFLRRADKHVLADVAPGEVEAALGETIRLNGRTIDAAALHTSAEATGGYPFLIQLVGYHVWRSATGQHIDMDAVQRGIEAARRRFGSLVHEPALADLSTVDRTFLAAMAVDDGPSRMADVIGRLGVDSQYANVYRTRLIEAEVIHATGHGSVDFALPYLREYLRDHAATLGVALPPS
jgi:hypothetical protein